MGAFVAIMGADMMTLTTLHSISDELANLPLDQASKRSVSLLRSDQLRVVLIRMSAGGELLEHSAPGQITILPVSGRFTVTIGNETFDASSDTLLAIDAGVRHSVRCQDDGAFVLTIAWPPAQDISSLTMSK